MPTRKKAEFRRKNQTTAIVSTAAGRSASHDPQAQIQQKINAKIKEVRGVEQQIAAVMRDTQEKVRQLEMIMQISELLNSTLDTAVIREKALQATCELLSCETASLLLVDRQTGELYWETALGEAGKILQKTVRLPINDRSIAGYVAMTGESLMINDISQDPRHHQHTSKQTAFSVRTMLCVPLRAKDKIIGVLQALNKLPCIPARASLHRWPDFLEQDLKLFETFSHQVAIAVENAQLYSQLKSSFYETVEALTEAIEKKDRYTGGHTKRVVYYSTCIAKYMEITTEELDRIRLGAILHDVGKIGIEDKILKKAAPLDPYEWPVMKTHPELGYEIMKRVRGLQDVIGGMRYHHERWDGKGYPLGLKGEEIPLIARVIAVADTYDAMISTRPYRKGLDPKVAFQEIVKNRGTQFCPTVVDAFIEAFQKEKMGKGSAGSPADKDD